MKRIAADHGARCEKLRSCPALDGLQDGDVQELAEIISVRQYEEGELLFFQGDKAEGFVLVSEGRVKVFRLGKDGREQVLHIMGEGEMIGEVPVFQGGRYPASAMAAEAVEVLHVPREKFVELGRRRPEVLLDLLAVLSLRLRRFVQMIDDLALKEVGGRLAKHLLGLGRISGETVRLETTKTVLAARIGTVAETLSRTLRKMQAKGYIEVEGKTIHLVNLAGLEGLAAGEKL